MNRKVLYPRVVLALLLAAGIVLSGVWQMAEQQWFFKPGMNGGGTGAAITAGKRIDAGSGDCLRKEKPAGCISRDGKRKGALFSGIAFLACLLYCVICPFFAERLRGRIRVRCRHILYALRKMRGPPVLV